MESIIIDPPSVCAASQRRHTTWIPLDNAANIFPSTLSRDQRHLFRLEFTLRDAIDPVIFQQALNIVTTRFPSLVAGLRTGLCWYSLEPVSSAPAVGKDTPFPMQPMSMQDLKKCCLRVLYDGSKVIVEIFHALCDGNAAMVFIKTLTAEYLQRRYRISIPCTEGILNRNDTHFAHELIDNYLLYAGKQALRRDFAHSFRVKGTVPCDKSLSITDLTYDETLVHEKARSYGVTVTEFLVAAMMQALVRIQRQKKRRHHEMPVRIAVPVNLRRFFPSQSIRNFVLSVTIEIDPRKGAWSFNEICQSVHHQMQLLITRNEMASGIATNVSLASHPLFKALPLFVKSALMRIGYLVCSTNAACLSISNLGLIKLPKVMQPFVQDARWMLDANPISQNGCGILSYGGKLHICLCRCMVENSLAEALEEVMLSVLPREYSMIF